MFHIAGPTHDWTGLTNEQGYRRHFAGTCPGQRTGPSLLVRARRVSVGPGDLWSRDVGTWHLVGKEHPARKGNVLYAAPWAMHTLKNTGEKPLTYYMVKWNNKGVKAPERPVKR